MTESILSEIVYLPNEEGVSKITDYGTEELRQFVKGLMVCQCPECESTEASLIDGNQDRRLCGQCGTCYRPEDILVCALIRAYQLGAELSVEEGAMCRS